MSRSIAFIPEEKLEKAMNVFWSKGYTASSLSDLTEAMAINKSSLYNSFGDKYSLFKACLKHYGKLVEQDYASSIDDQAKPIKNLENIIDGIFKTTTERAYSCMGIKTSFELASDDKEIRAVIKTGHDKTISLIQSFIKEAQSQGDIAAVRDSRNMAHFIFNAFAGMRQSFVIYGSKELVKGMAAELKAYLKA
ncbi:TetR/AcrR family transcriptional regulator [Flavobacterium sp. FlaQc-47]|uniref:TetR/AcrR family transcriptional regulator n=1 Tax=Flavobacterium sp. FlaQc-47 TaxID=3374180 RepID=UPI0037563042